MKTPKKPNSRFSTFVILHIAVFILSISTICAKFAANHEFLSIGFITLYAGVIIALGIYALIWQQVLKKISLTTAFVNKSASLVWSLLWGVTLFNETISASMIIGIAIVFVGVILVVSKKPQSSIKPDKAQVDPLKKESIDG